MGSHDEWNEDKEGVALIEHVIEHVRAYPRSIAGFCNDYPLENPQPVAKDVLENLRFPGGKPLSPSLKRWLEFDVSWLKDLGWFTPSEPLSFTPRRIDEIVQAEFDMWGELYAPLGACFPTCFLLPDGSDSRRIFAVTEPDHLGEYPVLVVDTDDMPYTGIMYPGFDIYMAEHVGLLIFEMDTYTDLFDDPRYARRLQLHADHLFKGKREIELFLDDEWIELLVDCDNLTM